MSEYTSKEVCELTGISYRRLSHWATHGVLVPSVKPPRGTGTRSIYSEDDIAVVMVMKELTLYLGNMSLSTMKFVATCTREAIRTNGGVPERLYVRFWRPTEMLIETKDPAESPNPRPYFVIHPSFIMKRLSDAQAFNRD